MSYEHLKKIVMINVINGQKYPVFHKKIAAIIEMSVNNKHILCSRGHVNHLVTPSDLSTVLQLLFDQCSD